MIARTTERRARHSHPRSGPVGHTAVTAVRLVAALLAVLIVAVGPPLLFWTLVGSPFDVPDALRSTSALTSPLDDQTVVWLLATAGWLAWLHLLGCLVVELLCQARGWQLRMPLSGLMFGGNQLLASHLVAALLVSGTAGAATGLSPARATTVTAGATTPIAHMATGPTSPTAVHADAAPSSGGPSPAAKNAGPAVVGQGIDSTVLECRVLPPNGRNHDTLWDIAERHLGDGLRWREVFALNEGRLMPDGQRLTRASLIHPGWVLRLPADAQALAVDAIQPQRTHAATAPTAPSAPVPAGAPTEPPADVAPPREALADPPAEQPSTAASPAAGGRHEPSEPTSAATIPALTADQPNRSPAGTGAGDRPSTISEDSRREVTTGLLGLAALGLLTALGRRRKIGARRRPPGTRAATPAPELLAEEARLRREARSAQDITAAVRLTLLLAARTGADVHVAAVWHHPDDGLELVLTKPDGQMPPAPTPFVATARGWLLPAAARRFLFATSRGLTVTDRLGQQLQDQTDPFPLLLPAGEQDGSVCLVNLEHHGLVSLDTEPADTAGPEPFETTSITERDTEIAAVLIGWTQQLSAAPWFELSRLLLAPGYGDAVAGSARASVLGPDDLARLRAATSRPQHHTPGDEQPSLARRTDAWDGIATAPDLLVGFAATDLPEELLSAAADPRQPLCALLTTPHPDARCWTLRADGTVTIPGIAEALTPPRLPADRLQRLRALLEHAEDPPHATPDDPGAHARNLNNPPTPHPTRNQTNAEPTVDTTLTASALPTQQDAQELPGQHAEVDGSAEPTRATVEHAVDRLDDQQAGAHEVPAEPESVVTAPTPETATDTPSQAADQPAAHAPVPPAEHDRDDAVPRTHDDGATGLPLVRIDILGPLSITGTRNTLGDTMRQIAVYLALHRRPVQPLALWEAIYPDKDFNDHALRTRLNELKGYVWDQLEKDGKARMLADTVQCDWQEFRALAAGDETDKLQALSLVRGRPFEDFQPDWVYLEGYASDLEAAIVDLALDVATTALARGDNATASLAAAAGLKASPYEERLAQLGIRAASHRGAHHLARALHRQLSVVLDEEIAPEDNEQPATTELMRTVVDLERAEQDRARGRT